MPQPDTRDPRWPGRPRIRAALAVTGEVAIASGVPTQMAIASLVAVLGLASPPEPGRLSLAFLVWVSLLDTVVIVTLIACLTHLHGRQPRSLWLGVRPVWREVGLGVLLAPVALLAAGILITAVRQAAPSLHNVVENPLEHLVSTPAEAALLGLTAVVAGGLREELQRAFLLRRISAYLGEGGAVIGVSLAFGLGHYTQGWDAAVTTGALGAWWAVVYLRRGSVVAPVITHALFNAMQIGWVVAGLTARGGAPAGG